METTFKAKQIGKPDLMLKNQIIVAYENLISTAGTLEIEIESCLNNYSGFGIDFIIEATRTDLERLLKAKYIELNKINISGISNDRLIESNLLDIRGMTEAINARKLFDSALSAANATRFIYPLNKLYIDKDTGWELTEDFYNSVDQAVCQFTKNEQQNLILDKMQQFCSVLNELTELNVLRFSRGKMELNRLTGFIDYDRTDTEKPYYVCRSVFHRINL